MMTDERYKKIMADLGMPNSRSLLVALQQVANEVGQAYNLRIKNLEGENQRLRAALDTIARLQLLGYITLGDTISTKMIDALAKTPVDQS